MCRVRNGHTDPPWTTSYVCITMDESCTDEHGNFVDKPLTLRMVQWQPYAVKKNFGPKTPVCSACKRTNRTKNFCRERHHHRHLPWCTVYVLLSALDNADPGTVVAGSSKPAPESPLNGSHHHHHNHGTRETEDNDSLSAHIMTVGKSNSGTPPTDTSHSTLSPGDEGKPDSPSSLIQTEPPVGGDDIHDVPESRTFLALVSSRGTSIHWLDLIEYEENTTSGGYLPHSVSSPADNAFPVPHPAQEIHGGPHSSYYVPHPAYAQQHQNALKSQQQYFFQLQQQQQPHPPPPPPQQRNVSHQAHGAPPGFPQWQQYNPMEMPNAGEAAAARRRGEEMGPQTTMWPVYHPYPPAPHMYPYPPQPGYMPHLAHHHHLHHLHHHEGDNGTGAAMNDYAPPDQHQEERDTKRLRTD